jgi:hypothetical protein
LELDWAIFGVVNCDSLRCIHRQHLPLSLQRHNWLGDGIYVWEHSPERAYQWACDMAHREGRPEHEARVVGVLFEMGSCLDLLDVAHLELIQEAYRHLETTLQEATEAGLKTSLPKNKVPRGSREVLIRELDCAVINLAIDQYEQKQGAKIHTVRGAFWEGEPAFEGSCIQTKSHVQIAIRDSTTILGYFVPSTQFVSSTSLQDGESDDTTHLT